MKYFGTDGIRQEANKFTKDFLNSIIVGLADYAGTDKKVLIGGDTRESSEWILQDLSEALESLGFEYASVNVLPTPAINYCFFEMGFDFAIDVTASHNPYTDNGIKIFERGAKTGIKLTEPGCMAIEKALEEHKTINIVATTDRANLHEEAVNIYKEHLLSYLKEADFSGLNLGMDCANGAMSTINKSIFADLGANVELINADENYGQGINSNCGSTHLEQLKSLVTENNLDFGIAFDGDGDRTLLINHNGEEVDGDEMIAILANYLNLDKIAISVMANQGIINWAKENHVHAEITPVGDSNVAEAMRIHHIDIGGEQSGHVILPGETTGDGMLTSLMITKVVTETNKPLHELASIITKYPQVIVNMPATKEQKENLKSSEEVKKLLLEYDEKLKSADGRLLVRPSGTELLIRITMWGNDKEQITKLANQLKNKLGEML
ncbi:phosphoglucosamine mutase [Candidatus Saccharibacteria bacterium]|nr:phosphoglucosamine mutase [Candidatus Saccharibacteria bacterium]